MKFLLLVLLFASAACSADHYETKAKVTERKMLSDSQLLIRYSFRVGNETIFDSVKIKNRVVPHDSLRVTYSPSDPRKNTLKFE